MNGDYFRLDSITGWRAAVSDHLIFARTNGALRLPPLAGRAKRVFPGGRPGLACVRAMVADECGNLYLLDAGKNLIRRKRASDGWLESLPAIGDGRGVGGSEPRMLREPRGLALDATGRLLIADTGNGRIQEFDPAQ